VLRLCKCVKVFLFFHRSSISLPLPLPSGRTGRLSSTEAIVSSSVNEVTKLVACVLSIQVLCHISFQVLFQVGINLLLHQAPLCAHVNIRVNYFCFVTFTVVEKKYFALNYVKYRKLCKVKCKLMCMMRSGTIVEYSIKHNYSCHCYHLLQQKLTA